MAPVLFHPMFLAAVSSHGEDRLTIFFTQLVLLIVVGRLLGELMQRMGQPAVMGQLLAGIVLGPSVFGAIWHSEQQAIFPLESSGRQMLNAVSELGILMLLLLTGMETDLALVKRVRRSAILTSAGGIVVPFICGYLLGEFLPDNVLPDGHRRLITSLFLATALSISSVKIVAAVLREVDFLRRDLGQVILASSILDDTIGWIILALIGGLAAHGTIDVNSLVFSVTGTALFLLVCLTIGGHWVARIIRWSNDSFIGEVPVISMILVIMLVLALVTSFIGVHTVLGAFIAGIMIGQSPILTKHIEEVLKGLIVALFMPVFFGVAGLSIDLKVLADPRLFELTLLVIVIASIGKLGGCYFGSRLGRLTHAESLAVGLAMNARGSTEIILATIGLSLGALNQQLFTVIVLMAVVTTMCMPPLLRWALSRVTVREDEKNRLEAETAKERDFLPDIERVLVGLALPLGDPFAARLAGWLIGACRISTSVIEFGREGESGTKPENKINSSKTVIQAAQEAAREADAKQKAATAPKAEPTSALSAAVNTGAPATAGAKFSVQELVSVLKPKFGNEPAGMAFASAILAETKNGYGLIFLGSSATSTPPDFQHAVEQIAREFKGPTAILFGGKGPEGESVPALTKIMVPTSGAHYSRFGAEVAVAIAKGCGASVTALHVSVSVKRDPLRQPAKLLRAGRVLVADIEELGRREGVEVEPKALMGWSRESVILREVELGGHQLIVIGTTAEFTEELPFGASAMALIGNAPCPVLIVKS